MKKLLILVPAFPRDDSTSYMVPFIQQFILAFVENYPIEVEIVSLFFPKDDPFIWNNIKVRPMNGRHDSNLLSKAFFLLSVNQKLKTLVKGGSYDGILSFWYREAAILGNSLSAKFGIKHYTWLQGQDVRRTNRYMHFFKPRTESLIALSDFQNQAFYQAFGRRANKVAPVSINPKFFPSLNTEDRPIDLLAVGSLIPLKNHQLFLEVVLNLKSKMENINAILIGNGPLENTYKEFIRANDLEENVTMTGLLTHKKTLEFMNASKVVLHSSTFEGGGLVCLEALYLGCHVISSLPIVRSSQEKFHYLTSKESIVSKIHSLLNGKPLTFESAEEGSMEQCCQLIYELFYKE